MIQRIQSIWLLIAAACAALAFLLPVYGGKLQTQQTKELLTAENYLLAIAAAALALVPVICIFLFKNRPLQLKLIWLSILLCAVFIAVLFLATNNFSQGQNFISKSYKLGALAPIGALVFLVLAFKAIRKDEKLIKSLDRLR